MNKTTLKNLTYAFGICLCLDLTILVAACVGKSAMETREIKREAAEILNTPDLSGY